MLEENRTTWLPESEVLEVEVKKEFGGPHVIFIRTESITNIFSNFYPVRMGKGNDGRIVVFGLEYVKESYRIVKDEATYDNGQRFYTVNLLDGNHSPFTQRTVYSNEMFKYIRNR
jgi:hypothetical protein